MGEALDPADLLAILLGLAVAIGCINHLWIRLPPAIGMLLGSLVSAVIVSRLRGKEARLTLTATVCHDRNNRVY